MAPIVIIARKQHYLYAILTLAISGFFMALITKDIGIPDGEIITAVLVGTFGVLTFIYTYCFIKEKSPLKTILIGVLFLSLVQMSGLVTFLMTTEINVDKTMKDYSKQVLEMKENKETLDLLEKEGYSRAEIVNAFNSVMKFINMTLPGLLVIDAIVTVLLTYMGLYYIQRRLKIKVLNELGFSRWRIPWYVVWIFIVALSLALIGDSFSFTYNKYFAILGYNLILAFLPMLAIIGLSIVTYLFSQVRGLVGIKILVVIMAIFNLPVIVFVMAILGAFDPFIDLRGYISKLQKKA